MCKNCQTKPVYQLTNKRRFCKSCFCEYLERKVFKTIRKFNMIQNEEKQIFILQGPKTHVLLHILQKFAKLRNEKISFKRIKTLRPTKGKKIIVALTDTLDNTARRMIEMQMSKKISKISSLNPIHKERAILQIQPLYFCLDKELEIYAKIKNLRFSRNQLATKFQSKLHHFLEKMEEKHPEIKHAVVNAFTQLRASLNKN